MAEEKPVNSTNGVSESANLDSVVNSINFDQPDIFFFINNLLNSKEDWLFFHSNRVQRYLNLLIDQEHKHFASSWIAGNLHDFGKIFVPIEILEAPRKLTDEEFEEIKEHTSKGYHIFKASELGDQTASFCLLLHHKHYDGGGYVLPKKPKIPADVSEREKENIKRKYNELKKYELLKGRDIPFLARVMSVADAFDAMTRPRPYRKVPLTPEQAFKELWDNKKTQFDPYIVEEFLRKEKEVLKTLEYFKEKEKNINTEKYSILS